MSPAFSQFDEPMAWLIRGLVEYGWVDSTRAGGYLPSGVFGGFNLLSLTEATDDGRSGLKLEVPALSGGRMCEDDGTYVFTAQVVRSGGGKAIALRCPDANYIQEFPYDPANPGWAAGYVHQALSEYVPQFVEWRLAGGEVPWAERRGMPSFDGESVGFLLLRFLKDKVQRNQRLDHGPAQGWWLDSGGGPAGAGRVAGSSPVLAAQQRQTGAAVAAPNPFAAGGIASMGKGGGDPVYMSAAARANIGVGMGDPGNRQALARLQGPGNALLVTSGLGAFQGLLWFINGITVIAFYNDQLFALAFSALLGLVLIPLGAAAGWGAWQYRQAKSGPFPWVAMAFAALTPGCCLGGIPVAVWALRTWRDPMVQRARGPG